MVNIDVPAGVGPPPLNTQLHCNLTHKDKGTQWGGGSSYVKYDHQKVHHSYWEKFQEIIQDPSVTMSPALTAFQCV